MLKKSHSHFFKKRNYGLVGQNDARLVEEFEITIPDYKFDNYVETRCGEDSWFTRDGDPEI